MSRKKSYIEKNFGVRLGQLIDDRLKVDRKVFATKTKISESYLSSIIKEGKGPSAQLISEIFIQYREFLDWLLTGEEPVIRRKEFPGAEIVKDTAEQKEFGDLIRDIAGYFRRITHHPMSIGRKGEGIQGFFRNSRSLKGRTEKEVGHV